MSNAENTPPNGGDEKPKKAKFKPLELTPEMEADLEEKHEDILVLRGPEEAPWVVALRRPSRQETIAYKHAAKSSAATASEALVRAICVFPEAKTQDFERQLQRWPFFVDGLVDARKFRNFVGITVENDLK